LVLPHRADYLLAAIICEAMGYGAALSLGLLGMLWVRGKVSEASISIENLGNEAGAIEEKSHEE